MGILRQLFGRKKSDRMTTSRTSESDAGHLAEYQLLREALRTMAMDPRCDFETRVRCGRGLRAIDSELCSGEVTDPSVQTYSDELIPLLLNILGEDSLRADFHDQSVNTLSNIVAIAEKRGLRWEKSQVESVLGKRLAAINECVEKEPAAMSINCQHTAWIIPKILKHLDSLSPETIGELRRLRQYPYADAQFTDVRQGAAAVLSHFGYS
jgi:hypothetical protein